VIITAKSNKSKKFKRIFLSFLLLSSFFYLFDLFDFAVNLFRSHSRPIRRGQDLPDTELVTSSPHAKDYPPNQAGKRAAYAAAWQNEKGEKGKFSDVQVHIIP
jgi:hypothetical protein